MTIYLDDPAPGTGWRACPDSTLVLPADAPRADWLAMRKTGIGGSDVAALMGDNPYDDGTPWFVWRDKTDPDAGNDAANSAMERGTYLEPIVVELFERDHPDVTARRMGLHRSREYPAMLVSVDRITDDRGGLECKTTTSYAVKYWPEDGSCPPLYAWQAKHALKVTGRSHWWVAVLVIDTWQMHYWRIERDEEELEYVATVVTEFWRTYVETRDEPPLDWDLYTSDEIRARYPTATPGSVLDVDPASDLAQRVRDTIVLRRALSAEQKEAKEAFDQTTDTLRAVAEGYEEVRVGGKKAFTNKQTQGKGRVTNEGILAAYPDVDLDKCKVPTGGRSLSVDRKIFT